MQLINRRHTRQVTVRGLPIGGGAPIPVQSMTATKTSDVTATLSEVERLEAAFPLEREAIQEIEQALACLRD